jgi:hypothetical protein
MLIALAMPAIAMLGGCGSATKTVSVASSPTSAQTTGGATQPTTSTATTPAGTTTGGASSGGGTPAPTTTRTAAAPAFTEKERGATAEGLAGALAVVHAHGYTGDYHPSQTLRVLVGTRTGSGGGHGQQAFFFVDGRYIGTDSSQPSAQVSVVAQGDTEATLAYSLYRSSDPLCCPGGGQARVRFQLNNGRLTPLDPIPPVSSTTGLSRQ